MYQIYKICPALQEGMTHGFGGGTFSLARHLQESKKPHSVLGLTVLVTYLYPPGDQGGDRLYTDGRKLCW